MSEENAESFAADATDTAAAANATNAADTAGSAGGARTVNLARPHEYDHKHSVSAGSGWLRAAVFGAMDGLVSNTALIAGIAGAGASPGIVIITGISGLLAGSLSMSLGEFASVQTSNKQLKVEVETERDALSRNPVGELAELAETFQELGMEPETAREAAQQVHTNSDAALRVHLAHELGLTPDDHPSPLVAAVSSFIAFSIGALIPLLPYFFAFGNLFWGLAFGGAGLVLAGSLAAKFTDRKFVRGGMRQLLFGATAVVVTFAIGKLLGVSGVG